MSQDNENIVTFEDENGDTVDLEIIEYFFYDGQEYVILADTAELGDEAPEDPDEAPEVDVYVMKVEPVDEENEDFIPVDPELEPEILEYAEKYLNGEVEDEEEEEDEDE